jgi:glutaredoxin
MIERNGSEQILNNDRSATAGTLALGMGTLLVVARALETAFGIPGLPRTWYQNDWLWWLIGFCGIGVGARLLVRSESAVQPPAPWKPTQPGRRFHQMVLYTREGCHLCDEAAETIQEHQRWLPPLTTIDIDSDPTLVKQFGTCVPVVSLDKKVRFRGKVNVTLLRRLIEGTPPYDL